jgi:hypothetical protein
MKKNTQATPEQINEMQWSLWHGKQLRMFADELYTAAELLPAILLSHAKPSVERMNRLADALLRYREYRYGAYVSRRTPSDKS